jgi:hypothetical protein
VGDFGIHFQATCCHFYPVLSMATSCCHSLFPSCSLLHASHTSFLSVASRDILFKCTPALSLSALVSPTELGMKICHSPAFKACINGFWGSLCFAVLFCLWAFVCAAPSACFVFSLLPFSCLISPYPSELSSDIPSIRNL